VLRVRRGVAELISTGSERKDVNAISQLSIEMDKAAESALIHADVAGKDYQFNKKLAELMAGGAVKVHGGTPVEVLSFFNLFDRLPETMPSLAGR
jgi:hypothetical protein